jgi:hypothetical protein
MPHRDPPAWLPRAPPPPAQSIAQPAIPHTSILKRKGEEEVDSPKTLHKHTRIAGLIARPHSAYNISVGFARSSWRTAFGRQESMRVATGHHYPRSKEVSMLDLAKAASFFFCILVIYRTAIHAFFDPGAPLHDRLLLALAYLFFAACASVFSGFIFTWPIRSNPDYGQRLISTLPVRVFLWASVAIVALFLSSWYLGDLAQQSAPFIFSRTLPR